MIYTEFYRRYSLYVARARIEAYLDFYRVSAHTAYDTIRNDIVYI